MAPLSKYTRHLVLGCLNHRIRNVCVTSCGYAEYPFENEKPLPLVYKGEKLDCGYRLDLVVETAIIVELKSCEKLEPIHKAQILTYLKLSNLKLGLLLNFNVPLMRDGIVRVVNKFEE